MELFPLFIQPQIETELPKPFNTFFLGITLENRDVKFVFESPQIGLISLWNPNLIDPELCNEYEVDRHLYNTYFSINGEYEGIIFYDASVEAKYGYCQPVFLFDDDNMVDKKIEGLNLFIERIDIYKEYSLAYTLYTCAKRILEIDTNYVN